MLPGKQGFGHPTVHGLGYLESVAGFLGWGDANIGRLRSVLGFPNDIQPGYLEVVFRVLLGLVGV